MGIFDFFKKKKVKQEKSLPKKSAEVEEVKELMKEISKAGGFDKYLKKDMRKFYGLRDDMSQEEIKQLEKEWRDTPRSSYSLKGFDTDD